VRLTEKPAATTARYVVPFAVFIAFLALHTVSALPLVTDLVLRTVVLAGILIFYSRPVIELRPRYPLFSVLIGAAVFAIWVGPDLLFPHYRQHLLFQNAITGMTQSSIPQAELKNPLVLFLRVVRAVAIVPIVEELFWRAWLMRWLISPQFGAVRMGTYAASPFWITALLFASEHGPYWDVGLVAGVVYNAWIVRTKSLADCILAHAVTNALLCAWVIEAGQWQYWL
jgi:uncharacterized protein